MLVRPEVLPFLGVAVLFGAVVAGVCLLFRVRGRRAVVSGLLPGIVLAAYFLYFFRDPERIPPQEPGVIAAAADGKIASVVELDSAAFRTSAEAAGVKLSDMPEFRDRRAVRISIFLSLFDVHVNRSPMTGTSEFLGYFPGAHFFTFQEKSSDRNQHNSILIRNEHTACLLNQIVGPVARRVVYWPDQNKPVPLQVGDRIGMMKFGSRLDLYFPAEDVVVLCRPGETVRAGETVIARLNRPAP